MGWSAYSESEVVSINTMSPPTIGTINTFNPFVNSTLTVPLSGGAQSDGSSFKRMANVYVDNELRYTGAVPSSYNNTSVSVSMSSTNVVSDLGNTSYSSSTRFKVVAWIQNSAGTKSNTVSKTFTVNINSDGGATPTLAAPTITGGSFSLPSSCFISGISTLSVKSGTGSVRRGGSVGVTLSYKIACTGYADKSGSSASYSGLTAGIKTITITCTDSRGLSSTQTKQIRVQSYSAPTIKNLTGARSSNPTMNAVLTYTLSYSPIYQYSSGVNTPGTQLNGINTQQISKDGSSWSNYTSGSSITGLSTENVYTITLRVSDKLRTTTYTTDSVTIPSADVGLALRKKRVGINCVPQSSYALEVKGNTYLNGSVAINGTISGQTSFKMNSREVLASKDAWLRINEAGNFSSGVYFGKSLVRTDGSLQVGSSGSVLNLKDGTFTYKGATVLTTANIKSQLLLAFPVGAIYITTTNTNPGTFLGGTWEQFAQGRTLIGAGTGNDGTTSMTFAPNGTGGEYYHKLTAEENGKHKHAQTIGTDNAVVGGYNDAYAINEQVYGGYANTVARITAYRQAVQYSGDGKGHNNVQPYQSVYYWHRIS